MSPILRGFAPIPRGTLGFPAMLVASSTDPFLAMARAGQLAAAWGAQLVHAGPCGHLNTASGHGEWPFGEALLRELM